MLPKLLLDVDGNRLRMSVARHEVGYQVFAEVLNAGGAGASSNRVNGVLHRVCGQDIAVVAGAEGVIVAALSKHVHAPLADGVHAALASDLDYADSELSV